MIVQNCVLIDLNSPDDFPVTTDGLLNSNSAAKPNICPDFSTDQKDNINKIMENFSDVFF